MNKAGNRSWTPDEIIKNWGEGVEASLSQVEISAVPPPINSFPPSHLLFDL